MKYIGLLRAVNVGGKNKIKMVDLRAALEAIDLQQVSTYIQSGNIIFDSDDAEDTLHQRIESHIEQRFGFHIDVILRTVSDFERMIVNCPFLQNLESTLSNPTDLYVALLNEPLNHEAVATLARYASADEQYRVVGRDIYLLLKHGMGQSKLGPQIQKLGAPATLRNWKTILKLHAMAQGPTAN